MTSPDPIKVPAVEHIGDPLPVTVQSESTPPAVKLVAAILGAALLVCILLVGLLAYADKEVPDVIQLVASGALGALSALLVGNRR